MPRNNPATLPEIIEAQQHAQRAAESNKHLSTCPYRPATDERTKFLQLVWARAYREAQAVMRLSTDGEAAHPILAGPGAS